ncbi:3-oxoacyl-[acyl-carrier-protein] synthase-3 [Paenibacillus castaneae]|uniref:ketoacyl-ACP synthase III n=1 Tax=Paenibacillus castaneae TaxID=474957 RepID=UPI000C9B5569|nr:ketoacyl-ACP synthase III [Paenibacillus castaneae]NIK76091.1 3-oxoacyl-[acyl-carrier-protein] synthase-3 [Paenibacillus castaneae]
MLKSNIKAIECYFPQKKEYNSIEDKLTNKIGIYTRNIAGEDESASDLAFKAAEKLFERQVCKREEIDFLIFCTQSPDYLLPTTACLLQDRLGLSTSCGAFDFNLGCSGFVYGLSLAKGLIETGLARNVLLLTADTYSKYINPKDRSVKVLFGDAAAATLITGVESNTDMIGPFVFGTDGRGKENLIVHAGGVREPISENSLIESIDEFGNVRSRSNLYMNGPEVFNFTLEAVPDAFQSLLVKSGLLIDDYSMFVFHQANKYMLEHLRKRLRIQVGKFSYCLQDCGNTVSSTIPIALKQESDNNTISSNGKVMLLGFGVGYSWAGCNILYNNKY